jgi:hypothetical protein
MKIPHLKRDGTFRPQIREAIQNLKASPVVHVSLYPAGGYNGAVTITISNRHEREFHIGREISDSTRFPARIRAAATELRDQGFRGRFRISHDDGALQIERA